MKGRLSSESLMPTKHNTIYCRTAMIVFFLLCVLCDNLWVPCVKFYQEGHKGYTRFIRKNVHFMAWWSIASGRSCLAHPHDFGIARNNAIVNGDMMKTQMAKYHSFPFLSQFKRKTSARILERQLTNAPVSRSSSEIVPCLDGS